MVKTCVICGGDETSGDKLLEAPCQRHWVCTDDVSSFFERATDNESLYPPKCCGQIFLLDFFEAHVPFEVQWAFKMKEQGEYSVLAKYRVYCANPSCSSFLSPATHVRNSSASVSYAVCMDNACGKLTCTSCKALLNGVKGHTCDQNEDYKQFKQTAREKGFQECPNCASTVELAEACNHIRCECGAEFCYICGDSWPGMHGCPQYGPAIYDKEGYNQDGFHRTTGLNHEGRTRREQARLNHNEDDDDQVSDEEDDDPDAHHFVLQHVEPDIRATFAALPHQEREAFLLNLQILLHEERGIIFPDPEERGDDGSESDSDGEDDNEDSGSEDDASDDEGEGQASDDDDEIDAGPNEDIEEEGQINELVRPNAELATLAASFDALRAEIMQGLDHLENGEPSSPASPDEDRPGTPMEVDSVEEEVKHERESWVGPPGGWPIDEEL